MTGSHVVVVGGGALGTAVCHALAALAPAVTSAPVRVTVLTRAAADADALARACQVRATVAGTAARFAGRELSGVESTLADLRPDALVCCASAQSPYERVTAPSQWTELVARAGFGVTLPFQAEFVARLGRTAARVSPGTLLVNGCFPDAVNPLLAALGVPVHCGIGNVATLAACLQTTLGLPDQRGLAVLGHHAHLTTPEEPDGEVRAWVDGAPLADVTSRLAADRALPRRALNAIAGQAAARLVLDLLAGAEVHTSLPGPLGLPGGYPVRLTGREIALRLPAGVSRADAVAWNTRAGHRDGVEVDGARVRHTPAAAAALDEHLPDLAAGWPAAALDDVAARLTALRQRLRLAQPVLADSAL